MRAALLALALLAGCANHGTILVRTPTTRGTGWKAPCGDVITVAHCAEGDEVWVETRTRKIKALVLKVGDDWAVIRPEEELVPGDSGSFVGLVEARIK